MAGPSADLELKLALLWLKVRRLLSFGLFFSDFFIRTFSFGIFLVNFFVLGEAFDFLDAPIYRVTGADVPMPYAKGLEALALPGTHDVVRTVSRSLNIKGKK